MSEVSFGHERGVGGPRSAEFFAVFPNPLTFVPVTGLTISTIAESNEQTVTGIAAGETGRCTFTIYGGTLIKNGIDAGSSGFIELDDVVKLTGLSSSEYETTISVTMYVNDSPFSFFSITTRLTPDTNPNQIYFIPAVNIPLNSSVTSNNQTVLGIEAGSIGRCSFSVVGGSLNKNGVPSGNSGYLELNDVISLTGNASPFYTTVTFVTLYINGVPFSVFSITSRVPPDITPDPLVFTPVVEAAVGATVLSNQQSISGVDPGVDGRSTFSITGGSVIKNGSAAVASGAFELGDTVLISITSSHIYSTEKIAKLYINGSLFSEFSVTTIMAIGFYADFCNGEFDTVRCPDAR